MLLRKFLCVFVCIHLHILTYISCENGISLGFAIDDTHSMVDVINQVKRDAKAILNMVINNKTSEVNHFVLVTINDPDAILRTATTSPANFQMYLNRVTVNNPLNLDCDEKVLAGIEKTLKFTKPRSYIFVFTDATTKDLNKLNSITKMCQKQQSQVVLVLTGHCGVPFRRKFQIYYDVAKACSGQVFRVGKGEVNSVLKTIEVLLRGKNSIFTWKTIPKTPTYVPVPFTLDEKAEYALVSVSGRNVELRVTTSKVFTGFEPKSDKTMWKDNAKVVMLLNPKPGTYYAWVKGKSTISIIVYGRTDFTFDYGFSVFQPRSMKDTTKQPVAGLEQRLTINVTDPDHSVDIKSLQILDIRNNDYVIEELPLKNFGDNMYITKTFISPNSTIKIAVKGNSKKTKDLITRYSLNIDPQIIDQIPEFIPDIEIDEGSKLYVNYGSGVALTCKVTAHPAPTIEWYSSNGALLPSNSSVMEDPLFVSYLRVDNVKNTDSYVCKASNTKGSGRGRKITINVRPVFRGTTEPVRADYNANFGEDVKMYCNITSLLPNTKRWYRSGKELSDNSQYSISPDGTELTLKSINIAMIGKYTCEATLNSDPTIKQTNDNELTIPGVAQPEVELNNTDVTVKIDNKIELNCKVVRGFPTPQIKWFKKNGTTYMPISNAISEVLMVQKALPTHAGQYKCEVSNEMGTDTATFDVTISSFPDISVTTIYPPTKDIPYDGNAEFMCKVESYRPPTIEWKTTEGVLLQSNVAQISGNIYANNLKLYNIRKSAVYVCLASNDVGSRNAFVTTTVLPPFELNNRTKVQGVYNANYGEDVKMYCNITSLLPITIRWYRSGKVLSDNSQYSISPDGTELTLKSINVAMIGKYTCEATLNSDPTIKQTNDNELTIPGVAQPEVELNNTDVTVKIDNKIELNCKVVRGFPTPQIKWFKKNGTTYMPISNAISEVLMVQKALPTHAGQYKCEVSNEMGTDTATFDVTISSFPDISVTTIYPPTKDIPYDGNAEFMCKVESYRPPTIEWKTTEGVLLQSNVAQISGNIYANNLKLYNIRKSAVYVCLASNDVGSRNTFVTTTVLPPFELNNRTKVQGVYNANYGEDVKMYCNITSLLPITIRWYRSGKVLSDNSQYSISPDGTELTLKSINVAKQGKYTCEATLNSDPTIKQTNDNELTISGVARPEIESKHSDVTVKRDNKIELNCKVVRGYSTPQIKWFKKKGTTYMPISNVISEVLMVEKALPTHAGQYKCEASNEMGTDMATFDVTISSMPEIYVTTIDPPTREIPYDGNAEFMCKVESYRLPRIVWKNAEGVPLQRNVTQISENVYANNLKLYNIKRSADYVCFASNNVGTRKVLLTTTVLPPFELNHRTEEIIAIDYGAEGTLQCDIKSVKPMTIRWHRKKSGVESRSVIGPSDKYAISEDATKLTINKMEMSMTGVYTCEASLLSDPSETISYKTTVTVGGLAGPEITLATSELKDNNFTAICRFTGLPKPVISWQFKPQGAADFSPIPASVEEFHIPVLQSNDTGVYKCIAQNEYGQAEHDFDVVAEEHPIITSKPNHYAVEGDLKMKILCDATGFPTPTIVWKKEGKVLNAGSKYVINGTTLYINKPVKSDSEEFTCEAKNKLGIDTRTFVVHVVDNFDDDENFFGDIHDVHAVQGKPKTIICNIAEGRTVRWFKDGALEKESDSTYTIVRASVTDEGNYTCRINTDEGPISETYVLYVGYAPNFEDNSKLRKTVNWRDGYQILDCSADSQPPATYKWLLNGVAIPEQSLQQLLITDWGSYTCLVSNAHGNISRTFDVITIGCLITMNNDTTYQPLISDIGSAMWPPSVGNSDVVLKKNNEVKLSCPSNKISTNSFKIIPRKNEINAKCITQDKFTVDGKTYRYSDLQCNNKVEPNVLKTGQECFGPQTELMQVGFEVNGFLDAYKVCFDRSLNVPLFASVSSSIPKIGNGVDLAKFEWNTATEVGHRKTGLKTEERKGSCKCCYQKSQLVNVNELPFGPAQAASFKDNLNSVPIWNSECAGSRRTSWQTFDEEIRTMTLINKWSTWTGASEWDLTKDGLVPKFLWKVLNYDEGVTVMVYVNVQSPSDNDIWCSIPCETLIEADKFLYCCDLDEFSSKFGVPSSAFTAK